MLSNLSEFADLEASGAAQHPLLHTGNEMKTGLMFGTHGGSHNNGYFYIK